MQNLACIELIKCKQACNTPYRLRCEQSLGSLLAISQVVLEMSREQYLS